MDYSCTNDRLIKFAGGVASGVAADAVPQWFRHLREEEEVLTELGGAVYPHALYAEGWRLVDEWHPSWPPACTCGNCSGMPYEVTVWQQTPGGVCYADFSDAHIYITAS